MPISVGRSIVATWEPHESTVLDVVRELGIELQIIFNKGAVMVLPSGVNKATGLAAALTRLKLSALNVVGIGDAENDHAFLQASGCAVAVANALPMVKADAEFVTQETRGAGVVQLIGRLIDDDLASVTKQMRRQSVELARDTNGATVMIQPQCDSLLRYRETVLMRKQEAVITRTGAALAAVSNDSRPPGAEPTKLAQEQER